MVGFLLETLSMSKDRRFNVRTSLDCFYLPSDDTGQNKRLTDVQIKAQENRNTSVLKMIDGLRLSSYEKPLPSSPQPFSTQRSLKLDEYEHVRYDSNSNRIKNDTKGLKETKSDCGNNDSLSDSAYSQSSDLDSDSASFITTISNDSNDLSVYRQIIKGKTQEGCETVTMFTASGFSIDIDVELTKTVIMLMKIILWLRQKRLPIDAKLVSPLETNYTIRKNSPLMGTKLPRASKRISFTPCTLLIDAVLEKSYQEAKRILETEEDIDVNVKTPSGQSLIHIAAANADLKCVRLLLEYGADPNIKDAYGWGPLHNAVRKGRWKTAILLIEAGANFAEYANQRINEYQDVIRMSRTCYKSMEIFV